MSYVPSSRPSGRQQALLALSVDKLYFFNGSCHQQLSQVWLHCERLEMGCKCNGFLHCSSISVRGPVVVALV